MKEMDDHGMRRIMEEAGVLPRHTSPDNVILLEDDKMEIDLNSSKVQEAMKRSGMTLREVSPGIMTLYGDGVQTKRFLEDLGDVELAKRLLAKAGIKEVASITEGEILAALDDIDMQTWDEVHKITVELKGMIEEITTLEARVNAKKMVLKA
jgi:hypothetical protein